MSEKLTMPLATGTWFAPVRGLTNTNKTKLEGRRPSCFVYAQHESLLGQIKLETPLIHWIAFAIVEFYTLRMIHMVHNGSVG